MKNYTTIFFSLFCFVLFFAIIVIFNFFFHFFTFISGAYGLPFSVFDPYFFLSNLYIIFYSIDYFSFVNFTLNLKNNYEFLFVETQFFQYISHLIFQSIKFFLYCFPVCLKISFFYFYIFEGWLRKKKSI
jgi:hypothetical protein